MLNPVKHLLSLTTYVVAVGFLLNFWLYCKTFWVRSVRLRWLRSLRCSVQTLSESPWERWLWEEPFPTMHQETDDISPPHVQEEKVSACPQRFHHGSPHWPNIRHKVKKQSAGFSQHIRPGSSSTKSFHDTCLTWQCFLCLNSHLPHPCREGRGTRGNRLGVILQLFGPGQDGVDIWDGVILKGTSAVP